MVTELTKDLIERAFDAMGRMAAERGLIVEIAVYGGSCLILASDIRGTSGDVDAVCCTPPRVATGLDQRGGDADGAADRQSGTDLLPFGEYPRSRDVPVGLRVFLPAPAYLLAMKILANRLVDDVEKIQLDLDDAVALMRVTNISTRDALEALMMECYPNLLGSAGPSLTARINAKLDDLMDAYARSANAPDPAWHAGRGPATRPR